MTSKQNQRPESLPMVNYNSAIANAVRWLGDRYLLAKPINGAGRTVRLKDHERESSTG